MTCTFFGHRRVPADLRPALERVLVDLIETQGADRFYVGHQGEFDAMVRSVLKQIQPRYPHITYAVVLAYMPGRQHTEYCKENATVYPEGLETTPPKFAISKRNRWMVEQADTVIAYVINDFGGAAQFVKLAGKKGKTVINLTGQ